MPTYDFRCDICNGTQELVRGIDEDTPYPICCGISMKRIFTALPIKFNGGGFYSTGG